MNQAIAERVAQPLAVGEWATMKEQANMLIKTGFLPLSIKTPEQVIAIAMTGRELGIGMMEAIRGINVIQGKPSVAPQLMLALAIRTGQMESYAMKSGTEGATVTVKRKGWPEHIAKFGPAEAKALGLDGKDNYRKQAGVMYQWRALAQALRFTFPDAVSGVYTPEEMGADVEIREDGSMSVKESPKPQPSVAMPQERPIDAQVVTEPTRDYIGEPERAKLFKFAERAYGPTYKEGLKGYIKSQFNLDSTKEMEGHQFREAIDWLTELAKTTNPHAPSIS